MRTFWAEYHPHTVHLIHRDCLPGTPWSKHVWRCSHVKYGVKKHTMVVAEDRKQSACNHKDID